MKCFTSVAALTALTFALSSCSAFLKSPIPGVRNKVTARMPHGLEYSTAMLAIKVAIGQAIADVRYMQSLNRGHPASGLEFQSSNATLTTVVQTEVNDGGNVAMVIPFSGLTGTLATPALAIGRGATTKQVKSLNFTLDPKVIQNIDPATIPELKGIRLDNGIREALHADFEAFFNVRQHVGISVQPRTLTYTFNLTVKRSASGGITLSIFPTTPSIRNIGVPNAGSSRADTTSSDLNVALSVGYPNPSAGAQPATLFYEEHGSKGSAWVQVPYTEDALKKVIGEKSGNAPKPGPVISLQELRELLEANKAQPMGEGQKKNLDNKNTPPIQPKLRTTRPLLKDPPGF